MERISVTADSMYYILDRTSPKLYKVDYSSTNFTFYWSINDLSLLGNIYDITIQIWLDLRRYKMV